MRHRRLVQLAGTDPEAEQLAGRLQALSDPLRLRLLALLSRGECPVGTLATASGVGQSLVSFHLAVLQDAGFVRLERAGRFTNASIVHGSLSDLLRGLERAVPAGVDGPDAHAAARAAPVLAAVLDPYARLLGDERVRRVVAEETARPGGSRDSSVVAGQVRERLRALAQAEGRLDKRVPEVLFVCVENAGRSQMAAGLAALRGADRLHAWSAGSRPGRRVPRTIVRAMAELGADLSRATPKPLTNDLIRAADVVVSMGCGEEVPRFPGVSYLEWRVPDPAGRPLAEVRLIRDRLDRRVRRLVAGLEGAA